MLGSLISQTCNKTTGSSSSYGSGSSNASSTQPAYRQSKDPVTEIPSKYQKLLQDFGKLVLTKLSTANFSQVVEGQIEPARMMYSEPEVLAYCGNLDLVKLGLLSKSRAIFVKPKKSQFNPTKKLTLIHPSLTPFLAAYYLQSQASFPQMLRKELDLLPELDQLQQNQVRVQSMVFQVLGQLMELLQNRGASVFLTLSLLDTSLNYVLALLR